MKVNIYKEKACKITANKNVSVIIPNYNYQDFILERIDSILLQTYPISQLIILDDASTDNSVDIINRKIEDIKNEFSNIEVVFIRNEINSGGCVFSQWQKGLEKVTGDYFWIAEADDSSNNKFLETAINMFEKNDNLVMFYSESYKIDEFDNITSENCADWCDIFHTGRWNNDFVNNGVDEIKNYLSNNNTILNVSSIVWKYNKKLFSIFEEAKNYKVAGDWYIYTRVLENGDIAFSHEALNYFRKHSKSVSTNIKSSIEYKETFQIQERIRLKYNLCDDLIEKQRIRRRYMGYIEDNKNCGTKGNVAWVVPQFLKGSGGHRTIFQNVMAMINDGYHCDVYIGDDGVHTPAELFNQINEYFGEFHADVFNDWNLTKKYDMIFATSWNSAPIVKKANCAKKFYFIQDYEPYFFSMGDNYIMADNTYKYGFNGVTIGRWLTAKMRDNYNMRSAYFNFCADLDVYQKINVIKENAICYVFQPDKPRRCDKIALKALQIVKSIRPQTKIYVYGSKKRNIKNLEVENLGIIPISECNVLYNKCVVGLCMSASNPSRIPFEMMAAGLPVVELYKENNLYDLPSDGCLLADSTPEAIATALLMILTNKKLADRMSNAGVKYMSNYPLEKGYKQFLSIINDFDNSNFDNQKIEIIYKKERILPSNETIETDELISDDVIYDTIPTSSVEKIKFSRRVKRKLKKIYHHVFK
jgi:glycosyltransferase involved in cell wall biosynthesis